MASVKPSCPVKKPSALNAGSFWKRLSQLRKWSRALSTVRLKAASLSTLTASVRSCQVPRSEEHTSELQSLMRISYAVFCLQKTIKQKRTINLEISHSTRHLDNRQ